jgi:hypothetical protein
MSAVLAAAIVAAQMTSPSQVTGGGQGGEALQGQADAARGLAAAQAKPVATHGIVRTL